MTGRVPLWGYLIGLADQRPLLGYGLAAGFTKIVSPQIEGIGYGQFLNAHNGFMEILISFGYVGLALCLALLAWQFWIAARLLISGDEEKSHIKRVSVGDFHLYDWGQRCKVGVSSTKSLVCGLAGDDDGDRELRAFRIETLGRAF